MGVTVVCGLFGTIRPLCYSLAARRVATGAIHDLGRYAEERGVDSAGVAVLGSPARNGRSGSRLARFDTDRWQLVTALGPYGDHLPTHGELGNGVRLARVVLGHTRWATQGPVVPSNASPMLVGDIVGTHNGDVTAPIHRTESTDSAWLFGQLNRAAAVSDIAAELAALRGRAALVWARQSRPGLLYLARAALSPLATAVDRHAGLWWASNPAWLRRIDEHHGLGLSEPVLLPEGQLVVLSSGAERITTVDQLRFIPTCRPRDDWIADSTCWRGFTSADRESLSGLRNHRVESVDGFAPALAG